MTMWLRWWLPDLGAPIFFLFDDALATMVRRDGWRGVTDGTFEIQRRDVIGVDVAAPTLSLQTLIAC
jgi:hypothetical protein